MKFDDIIGNILNESPFDDIGQIRSTKFTEHPPVRAKFKKGDIVSIGYSDHADVRRIRNRYGKDATGVVVGMQRATGPGRTAFGASPMNRYYVKFEDGKIYPLSSFHLQHGIG